MSAPRRKHWQVLAVLTAVARLAVAAPTAPAARAALQQTARQTGMKAYERQLPSGVLRQYVNPSGPHELLAIERTTGKGSNVLEILHSGTPGAMHTLAKFDGELIHTQYVSQYWRLRSWGDRLRPSAHKLFSAMIQLSPKEGENLRAHIELARQEQGPEALAGANWEKGHIRTALGADKGINCTSTWCGAPIGERGEPLWQVIGLRGNDWSPHSFQRSLENDANERVFGIAVYGPKLGDFGARLQEPQFNF